MAGGYRGWLAAASLAAWATAVVVLAGAAEGAPQKTANSGVYSKVQADAAEARFNKICADCHTFTVADKKRPGDLPLGGEPFLKKWDGRPLDELVTLIVMTMPNDGSAEVSDAEAVDLVAYILQQNGFPPGASPLTKSGASAVLTRPGKLKERGLR